MSSNTSAPSLHSDGTPQTKTLAEQRRIALAEVDNADFGWFHIKACLVSGVGFFTDAYDIFIINLVVAMLGYVYYKDHNNTVPPNIDLGLKASVAIGTFIGQLLFGWLADRMYGVELVIIVFTTFATSLAGDSPHLPIYVVIIIWRLLLGIGIGGDYPLSAIITSEFATTKRRGAMMAAVFAMQGFGILAAAITATLVLLCYKSAIDADVNYLDDVWRICIGLGIIPGLMAMYFRFTIPETPRYKMDVMKDVERAVGDVNRIFVKGEKIKKSAEGQTGERQSTAATWAEFFHHFGQWRYFKLLLGTSVTWFALDVAFYGMNLNNSVILKAIGFTSKASPYEDMFKNALGNVVIAFLGTVPGYWFTVFFVDSWGRRPIQLMGFSILTVLYLIAGLAYHPILDFSVILFIAIYTLCQFFQNFGPNATTFIVPGEMFPTKFRSTAHGISAASGKLGAIISQVGFSQLKDIGGKNMFVDKLLIIFAVFMFIGLVATWLWVPETKGKSLEELAGEDDDD